MQRYINYNTVIFHSLSYVLIIKILLKIYLFAYVLHSLLLDMFLSL